MNSQTKIKAQDESLKLIYKKFQKDFGRAFRSIVLGE